MSHFLTFYVKVVYAMGKALSGELSCMGTGLVTKGNNFWNFLFASLDYEALQIWTLLLK